LTERHNRRQDHTDNKKAMFATVISLGMDCSSDKVVDFIPVRHNTYSGAPGQGYFSMVHLDTRNICSESLLY